MGSTLLVDTFLSNQLFASGMFVDGISSGLAWLALFDGWLSNFAPVLAEATALERLGTNVWLGIQVALGLGFVIFVHELGHFLAAKTFGVRCDKFYIGFDVPISIGPIKFPRTLGKFQWGETEYGIGIVPLGGYVKMLGQDDDPRNAAEESDKIRQGEGEEAPLDPRSYPAKPVWQRMIIISAGVVMNLIFAVFLAAGAYRFGVPYTPTVAGGTLAGGPAWSAGIETGDQVLKFGSMADGDSQLRYDDFAVAIAMGGFESKETAVPVTLLRNSNTVELSVAPTADFSPDKDIYRIGMLPPTTPTIGPSPYMPNSFLADKEPDLKPNDVITAVNGTALPVDERFGDVLGSSLTSQLQANYRDPVTVTVKRTAEDEAKSSQELKVELPAVPVKSLGIGFKPGPITAIQSGSIAEKAGFKVGDVIVAVNDAPVTNGLQLPDMVARLSGEEVTLTVQRGTGEVDSAEADSQTEELKISFENAAEPSFDPIATYAGKLSLGGVGIAFTVSSVVASVDENIGDEVDVKVGDELVQIQWVVSSEQKRELSKFFTDRAFEQQLVDNSFNMPCVYDLCQGLPDGATIKCFLRRDSKTIDTTVTLKYADDWYWHQRGIGLSPLMETYQTESIAAAMNLGLMETSKRFSDVLNFLKLLVTGKIGAKGVGGPLAIAEAASSEASFGVSRLMLFLTLLSANLAILNFLPIPALDGGHMVFLTAEAIRGKPVSEALQVRLTMIGVLGLLSLMAFVIIKDIMRYL